MSINNDILPSQYGKSFFNGLNSIVIKLLFVDKLNISNTSWPSFVTNTAFGGSSVKELDELSKLNKKFNWFSACDPSSLLEAYLNGRSVNVNNS